MDERVRQVKREYYRNWRRANPDKVKEYQRRYWERKARQINPTNLPDNGNGGGQI